MSIFVLRSKLEIIIRLFSPKSQYFIILKILLNIIKLLSKIITNETTQFPIGKNFFITIEWKKYSILIRKKKLLFHTVSIKFD